MFGLISFIMDNWYFGVWFVAIIVAYIYGGKRLAFIVGTLGFGIASYLKGSQTTKRRMNELAHEVQKKREKAYDKIDSRNTNRSDVVNRLRKRSF